MKKVLNWIDDRLPIISMTKNSTSKYPAPKNLSYMWNFGSLAMLALVIQLATGLFLAMFYKPDIALAFGSIEHIMRNVEFGWLIRYMHSVGASFFFIVVYIHMARGLYYGSYKGPRELLWIMGLVLFFLMMATAFLGYVLPWGQMSYWGAQVITNLLSVIPFIGDDVVIWLWGGYTVGDPTLNRFFALHFLVPFIIVGFVILHVWALHVAKSNNPTGVDSTKKEDYIPFHPYYTVKDLFGVAVYLLPFLFMVFYLPEYLGHSDNYIPADPLKTPAHIVPEWYFLPFYAILRAIPIKELGVLAMFGAIAILFVLPWLDKSKVRSATYRPIFKKLVIIFFANFLFLGYVGMQPADFAYHIGSFSLPLVWLGGLSVVIYFGFFISLLFIHKFEKAHIPSELQKKGLDNVK